MEFSLVPDRRKPAAKENNQGFQELTPLGCQLELRDGIEFLECRGEGIRKAPNGPRPEFLVLRFEVQVCRCRLAGHTYERGKLW